MLDSFYSVLAPLNLVTLLATIAALLIVLPFVLDHLSYPRALGTKHRPDLYTPKGTLPFLGLQLRILQWQDRQPELQVQLWTEHRASGDKRALSHTILGGRFVTLHKSEHIEWMQRTNFKNYAKGQKFREVMSQVLGHGIFTSDGLLWNLQRKATARVFTNSTYRGIISSSISRTVDDFLALLSHFSSSAEPQEINLSKVFFSATLDTFCDMAFSTKPGALEGEKEGKSVPFAAAFDSTQQVMARRFQQPFWPIIEFLTGTRASMHRAVSVVHSYANEMIEKREKELDARRAAAVGGDGGGGTGVDGQEGEGEDLLAIFLGIRDEDGKGLERQTVRDAVINLLIAGRDTTASTLSWLGYHLLRHPPHIDGIRAEATALDIGGESGKMLEFDQMKEVDWTMACWYEAARLHPSVPVNFWTALRDDQFPAGGPRVEKGDFVAWSDWTLHRDSLNWGDDAGTFNPQRWLHPDGKGKMRFSKESEYKMHAFNGGRRRCLGETLATFEGLSLLLSLFSTFDLRFADDYLENTEMVKTEWCQEETPRYQNALTLPMLEPLRVVVTKRNVDGSA
ncbi:hypothetical protein JCM11251_006471 [Rhodosporidiobolus azoricus]